VPHPAQCTMEVLAGVRDPEKIPDSRCERCDWYHDCCIVTEMIQRRNDAVKPFANIDHVEEGPAPSEDEVKATGGVN
jgi:hypothetical protein